MRGLQLVFHELSGFWIEASEHIRGLSGVPDRAVSACPRIVRSRARSRNRPLNDGNLHRTRNDSGGRLWFIRERLDQVFGHGRPLLERNWDLHVLHHMHDRMPSLRGVASTKPIDGVTSPAGILDNLFAGPHWEIE